MNKEYKKLSELQSFKVVKFVKKFWQNWDNGENRYVNQDEYFEGASPRYLFELEDCMCHFSSNQLGMMLVSLFESRVQLEGQSFTVKTNGKTGKEIRYFINLAYDKKPQENKQEEISVDDINF